METISTSSAMLVQNSVLTSAFLIIGQTVVAAVFLVGLIVILKACFNNLRPRKKWKKQRNTK